MYAKQETFHSQGHLDVVRRCPCIICSGLMYHTDDWELTVKTIMGWATDEGRKSDPHHVPDDEGGRRRTSDLGTVPLCRTHHGWMDTAQGKVWEKQSYNTLRRIALEIGVKSGVVERIEDARRKSDEELHLSDYLVPATPESEAPEDASRTLGIPKPMKRKKSRMWG